MEDNKDIAIPQKWSDITLDPNTLKTEDGWGTWDGEVTISMKTISDWEYEFSQTPDNVSSDDIQDLRQKGCEVESYLISVKWRVHFLYKCCKADFEQWKSRTASGYALGAAGKEPSEAARDRMIYGEEKYHQFQVSLAKLESMEGWCEDKLRSIRDSIKCLGDTIQLRIQAHPSV